MKVGLDFDNTIVNYDNVFYKVAYEKNLIPKNIIRTKNSVRDFLRQNDKNDIWTEIQGYVYGKRMSEVEMFNGFINFYDFLIKKNIEVVIISHKTRFPYSGEKFDLRNSALSWIEKNLSTNQGKFPRRNIFFEDTKEKKALRIKRENCDFFIDDLPEIFELSEFPQKPIKILFNPEKRKISLHDVLLFENWNSISRYFQCMNHEKL